MIASRLVAIARDITGEYGRFRLTELLQRAARLSTDRPSLQPVQYSAQANELKAKAREVLEQNVFRTYPLDTLKILTSSDIASILPATIANLIIAGFPDRKEDAISSAELNMYLNEASNLLGQINGFLQFSSRMGITKYELPEGKVALDIKLPRSLFRNEIGVFEEHLSNFSDFFRSVMELVTGTRENAELFYLSTAEPIVSLAVLGSVAYAVLKFYKLFLEVAEKHVSLYKAIKELRGSQLSGLNFTDVEKGINAKMDASVEEAVTEALAKIPAKVPPERLSELKIEINRQAIEIVADITKGARIFVSLESQKQVELLAGDAPDTANEVRAEIEQQKLLETRLDTLAIDLQDRIPLEYTKLAGWIRSVGRISVSVIRHFATAGGRLSAGTVDREYGAHSP